MLTLINISIKARSVYFIFTFIFTAASLMFNEGKVVIPSMLLCSSCDSLNLPTCVVEVVVAACGLEKRKRILLPKKDSFVLINLKIFPVIDLM